MPWFLLVMYWLKQKADSRDFHPYPAEFLKWNCPPFIFGTVPYKFWVYQNENLKLTRQQYIAWSDCMDCRALYWWQRLITSGSSRVTFCFTMKQDYIISIQCLNITYVSSIYASQVLWYSNLDLWTNTIKAHVIISKVNKRKLQLQQGKRREKQI